VLQYSEYSKRPSVEKEHLPLGANEGMLTKH